MARCTYKDNNSGSIQILCILCMHTYKDTIVVRFKMIKKDQAYFGIMNVRYTSTVARAVFSDALSSSMVDFVRIASSSLIFTSILDDSASNLN